MSDVQTGDIPSVGRRKKIPYYQRELPPRTPLPTGSVLDVFPFLGDVDLRLQGVMSVQELVLACRYAPSTYWQEALITRFGLTRQVGDAEWNWLMAQPLGIHEGHPLYKLRTNLVEAAEGANPPSINEEDTLVIWGAPWPKGKPFYLSAGVLMRSERLRKAVEYHPEDGVPDYFSFLQVWAQASGVTDGNTLRGLRGQLAGFRNNLLNEHPEVLFAKMGPNSMEWVHRVSQTHGPIVAFYLFRCLQRVASYMQWNAQAQGYLVRWRSGWLRGAGTNEEAIPGASGHSRVLTEILRAHVFELYEGHSAGTRAATYKLRWVPDTGRYTEEDAARRLGLQLRNKKPVRTS